MTGPEGGLAARARGWRDADPDPETRAELGQLLHSGDDAALAERFEGSLTFGTAGIRAAMGAGPLRMNRLVAGRVAAGLARYIAAGDSASLIEEYKQKINSCYAFTNLGLINWLLGI